MKRILTIIQKSTKNTLIKKSWGIQWCSPPTTNQ